MEETCSCTQKFKKAVRLINNHEDLVIQLAFLGVIPTEDSVRTYNIGKSDYSKHIIQPWSIIQDYNLDYWDGDIIKRILRTKEGDSRKLDYEKVIHICREKIRQIEARESISSYCSNNMGNNTNDN